MKITFISNFHNHHQMPLCDAFLKIPDVDFTFIATEKVPEDRVAFGYKHDFSHLSYYMEAIEESDIIAAEKLCFESDVVIIGSAPASFVKRRLRARKLTFNYNERWFKEGFVNHPGDIYRALRDFSLRGNKNYYQLCASAYTAGDSKKVFAFPNRKLRWGYFPEVKQYDSAQKIINGKTPASIVWVARLIDWKHPEAAIELAQRLKQDGYKFNLNIIGNGPLEEDLRKKTDDADLNDCVHFLGAMSPEEVRGYMESSQVFLFTSDFNEGWGAVLNEAMNSACAVVASHAIGSVPYLIKHGENGFIYSSGYDDELYDYVKRLLTDKTLCEHFGREAYLTMTEVWNGDVAANRLYEFCRAKLSGKELPEYDYGPVSKDLGKVKNSGKFKRKKY